MKKLVSALAIASFVIAAPAMAQIKIKGDSRQEVNIGKGGVANTAAVNATAKQNLASNKGKVEITGKNVQIVNVDKGGVANTAAVGAKAEQNLATNTSD